MNSQDSVSKRNRRHTRAYVALALVFALVIAGYVLWTRVSAVMVLRYFVREAAIPLQVHSASWDVRLSELFSGKIRDLNLSLYYEPMKLPLWIHTPVEFHKKGEHWTIRLRPKLTVADFPTARGRIDLELDVKRRGSDTQANGVAVEFHLRDEAPLRLANENGAVSAGAWKIDGHVLWDPREAHVEKQWSSQIDVQLDDAKIEKVGSKDSIAVKTLKIETDLHWPSAPPAPMLISGKITAGTVQALLGPVFFEEPAVSLRTTMRFDGKRFEDVDISVDKPLRVTARGSFGDGRIEMKLGLRATLASLVQDRLATWLEPIAPILGRAKAQGTLDLRGSIKDDGRGLRASGKLAVEAKTLELPSKSLFVDNLSLALPLAYPGEPDWGRLRVGVAEFHSVKLKNLAVETRVSTEGVAITTERDDGGDAPIRQNVWGGSIDIANLYAHVGGEEGLQFAADVRGGPFNLPEIQKDLCIMPQNPMKGQLSFTYPEIVLDADSLRLIGDVNLNIFNGTAHIGDMHLLFPVNGARDPKLKFDLDWDDLDLYALGEWSNFGDMRGSLEGGMTDATFVLTPIGPQPMSYNFLIRGRERSGKRISFYGRAMDNIVRMITGDGLEDVAGGGGIGGAAGLVAKAGVWLRNLMPANAHYMGFQAKSDGTWTELSTFDPTDGSESALCDPKKHYLLCGTAFKIPLNTSGVYPVIMKSDAFQGWLAGMLEYFKGRAKNDKKPDSESQCTPIW